jgi:DNA-binding GntR family transcriptional regulator
VGFASQRDNNQLARSASNPRGTIQDRVLATLRNALMSGHFLPGQVVSLRKLANSLGTSPMPVRESLSRLVAAYALEELPNRSVRVPLLTYRGLVELFDVRCLIEGMAARAACAKVDDALIVSLEAINAEIISAHAEHDMTRVLGANQKFHFMIYQAANSDILMPLIESLWLRCGPTMYFSLNSPRNLWDASTHMTIIDAFRRRDGEAAAAAMVVDIRVTGDYLLKQAAAAPTGPFAPLELIDAAG